MGRGWPWYGRMHCQLLQHVRVTPPGRGVPAEPVPVDVPVGSCRAADLAPWVGVAAQSLPAAAPAGRLRLTGPSGARDEASGRDDERGDVLGGLAGDLEEDRGIGVGGQHDAGVAEHVLYDLQVHFGGQGEGGRAVPQVVQPDRRQPGLIPTGGGRCVTAGPGPSGRRCRR
jgi:hypothetical protein